MSDKIYILVRYELKTSGHGQSDPEIDELRPFYYFSKLEATQKALQLHFETGERWTIITLDKAE